MVIRFGTQWLKAVTICHKNYTDMCHAEERKFSTWNVITTAVQLFFPPLLLSHFSVLIGLQQVISTGNGDIILYLCCMSVVRFRVYFEFKTEQGLVSCYTAVVLAMFLRPC